MLGATSMLGCSSDAAYMREQQGEQPFFFFFSFSPSN